MTRYVIIGTGVSGFSAAQTLTNLEPSSDIILISEDPHGFYSRPGLAYYLTGEIPEKQLFPFRKWLKQNPHIHRVVGRVTRIDSKSHAVDLNSAEILNYDRLLIATGAKSIPLGLPGADLRGVVKLDDLEDAREILSHVRHTKTAVVVGGGVLGLELVEGLVAHHIKVHYLLRGEWYWSNVFAELEARMIEHNLVHHGVVLHHRMEITDILSKKGKIIGVRTTGGDVIRCDMLAVGIGVKARTELAQAAGLKQNEESW